MLNEDAAFAKAKSAFLAHLARVDTSKGTATTLVCKFVMSEAAQAALNTFVEGHGCRMQTKLLSEEESSKIDKRRKGRIQHTFFEVSEHAQKTYLAAHGLPTPSPTRKSNGNASPVAKATTKANTKATKRRSMSRDLGLGRVIMHPPGMVPTDGEEEDANEIESDQDESESKSEVVKILRRPRKSMSVVPETTEEESDDSKELSTAGSLYQRQRQRTEAYAREIEAGPGSRSPGKSGDTTDHKKKRSTLPSPVVSKAHKKPAARPPPSPLSYIVGIYNNNERGVMLRESLLDTFAQTAERAARRSEKREVRDMLYGLAGDIREAKRKRGDLDGESWYSEDEEGKGKDKGRGYGSGGAKKRKT